MTSFNQRECAGCGLPCDGFYCYLCTCQQCGVNLLDGTCLNCTIGDGKPVTCCGGEGSFNGGNCPSCSNVGSGNEFFPEIHYPPQATDTEVLQARENLMETIQAFLKEYDHIPPNEKCMALLLAEERFLKIKQTMEELLLKLMNDLQILKGIQQEKKEMAAQ
ncbi:hypothetical protein Tco_1305625, partial [Tanacetum coccineum]